LRKRKEEEAKKKVEEALKKAEQDTNGNAASGPTNGK
jgi:hypothetical protein